MVKFLVDSTGAGDACCSGLLYAYLKGVTPETAARMSGTTATTKITFQGRGAA